MFHCITYECMSCHIYAHTHEHTTDAHLQDIYQLLLFTTGAPGVGISTLKNMLISRHPGEYADCVPCEQHVMYCMGHIILCPHSHKPANEAW